VRMINVDWLVAVSIVLVTLILVSTISPRASKKSKRFASSAMAGFDEIFSPANYSSRIELEEQSEKVIPSPSPEEKKL
jgi:hypothetical protein